MLRWTAGRPPARVVEAARKRPAMEEAAAAVLAVRRLRMERREVLKRRESLQIDSRRTLAKHHLKIKL